MQFNFNCEQVLGCDQEGFSILEGSFTKGIKPGHILYVNEILDKMGQHSSKAQNLNTIITTSQKFFSSNHRIFIKAKDNNVIGYIKVGVKKLFIRDQYANYYEIKPLCVLDFYVHESQQRGGHGKTIFDFMLDFEKVSARLLAYDSPSPKLIGFLRKYFGLGSYIPQNNNFLLFNDYFEFLKSNKNNTSRAKSQDIQQNTITNNNITSYRSNFANIGQNLMFNPSHTNIDKISLDGNDAYYSHNTTQYKINNSQIPHHNDGFSNYFLNGNNTNYYDQIYSKRKLQLLNDYITKEKLNHDEYVKEQLNLRGKETQLAKERVKQLESHIDTNNHNFFDYVKRNEYKTIFDDKKVLEKKQYLKSPLDGSHRVIGLNGLSYIQGIKADVLPTTSSAYGAYFNKNDIKNKIFY